ncbi:hypothetical protein [Citrobacter freundii]|uniref:hypothetical protein n=1 Tax=Citrobacter freundii TaxID=546 RepID=UPI001BCB7CC1|nr:hypothetical protein [Citrobacter freundii]
MASTITRQPMTAHQLVHAVHALSRSHLYTLKAVECLPENEREAAAEKVVSELMAFIEQNSINIEHVIEPEEKLPPHERAAQNISNCKPREYTTPYGHKLSQLSELAHKVADAVEDDGGRTYGLYEVTEHKSLCMLIDMLVDAGVLPLNSVKKLDGISLSQLQSQLVSVPNSITISSPAVTITSSSGIVTAGIDSLGLRDES